MPVSLSREFTLAAFWVCIKTDPVKAQQDFWTLLDRYQRLCLNHIEAIKTIDEAETTLKCLKQRIEQLEAENEELKTSKAILQTRCMQQQFVIDELEGVNINGQAFNLETS